MEEEQSPLSSMDPAVEVVVCGEDGSEETQEGEGGEAIHHQGRSCRVREMSEAIDLVQEGGGGEPLELHPDILRGGMSFKGFASATLLYQVNSF